MVGAETHRAQWYRAHSRRCRRAIQLVKAALLFNVKHDQTVTYQKVDWTVEGDSVVRAAIADAVQPWAQGGRIPFQPVYAGRQ